MLYDNLFEQVFQKLEYPNSQIRLSPQIDVYCISELFVHAANLSLQVHEIVLPGSFINGDKPVADELLILVKDQSQNSDDIPRG